MLDGRLHQNWDAVVREIDWARRRVLRSDDIQGRLNMAPNTLVAGAILRVPTVDGNPQALPSGPQALQQPLGPPESSSDSEDDPSRFFSYRAPRLRVVRDLPN